MSEEEIEIKSSKFLMVEGGDDKNVVESLLKKRNIIFEDFEIVSKRGRPAVIESLKGIKAAIGNYEVIGVIIDADDSLPKAWEDLKGVFNKLRYKNIPSNPNPKGTILINEEEELPKMGVWIMPNNKAKGAIEDFFRFLIPDYDELLPIAEKKVNKLISTDKNRFSQAQKSKAIIYTWLAWQERPGTPIGEAVTNEFAKKHKKILDDGKASRFIEWLKKLFR